MKRMSLLSLTSLPYFSSQKPYSTINIATLLNSCVPFKNVPLFPSRLQMNELFQYEEKVKAFLDTDPEEEAFRNFLLLEDVTEKLNRHDIKGEVIYNVLTDKKYSRYMDVLLSFYPPILNTIRMGDYAMHDWVNDGRYEFFASLFRYYTMEEIAPLIDENLYSIIRSKQQDIFDILVSYGYPIEKKKSHHVDDVIL
jgi:hypothetical protein